MLASWRTLRPGLGCTLGMWLGPAFAQPASLLPILPPLLHCCYKQGMTNGANHVTRAMVQWCVAVYTTFRPVSWLRGVLWRARWSWTWTWSANNVSDALDVDLLLPLRVWVGLSFFFFFYLWLWLWLWLRLFFGPREIPWVFVFHLHFFLRFFSFFFWLRLWLGLLVALLFSSAGDMPGLVPDKGDIILFCKQRIGRMGKHAFCMKMT